MSEILSYCFRDKDGRILDSYNEKLGLMPASNMKVVSGYTAYRKLGKDFVFRTNFSLKDGELSVWGDPSPLLDQKKLTKLIRESGLKPESVNRISFSDSVFDMKVYADGWSIEDEGHCYQTKVVPYAVSEGCYSKDGQQEKPLHDYALSCVEDQYRNFARCVSQSLGMSETLPYEVHHSDGGSQISTYEETLLNILDHIEIFSCNFSIEVLSKYLSHLESGEKGTWKHASGIITKFMSDLGLDTSEIQIVDASGLSRLNLLTTDFLSSLIHKIVENGDMDFIEMLPSPGKGTLRNRLSNISTLGLFSKTGSINHCSSLTGFIRKGDISFSVIINNSLEDDADMRKKIDGVITEFLQKQGLYEGN